MVEYEIDQLMRKSKTELVRMLLEKEDFTVPTSIFSTSLGPLEALVLYLKDNKKMPVSQISLRLNRHAQTIWTSYYQAKKSRIILHEEGAKIPLSIFSKKQASALESLCHYMKESLGMRHSEIAEILKRDIRTVWTCYKRFETKNHAHKSKKLREMIKEEKK